MSYRLGTDSPDIFEDFPQLYCNEHDALDVGVSQSSSIVDRNRFFVITDRPNMPHPVQSVRIQ